MNLIFPMTSAGRVKKCFNIFFVADIVKSKNCVTIEKILWMLQQTVMYV